MSPRSDAVHMPLGLSIFGPRLLLATCRGEMRRARRSSRWPRFLRRVVLHAGPMFAWQGDRHAIVAALDVLGQVVAGDFQPMAAPAAAPSAASRSPVHAARLAPQRLATLPTSRFLNGIRRVQPFPHQDLERGGSDGTPQVSVHPCRLDRSVDGSACAAPRARNRLLKDLIVVCADGVPAALRQVRQAPRCRASARWSAALRT